MFEVTVSAGFCASHRIKEEDGSYEALHGHNWRVEATARRATLTANGLALDFRILERMVAEAVADFDHRHLNDLSTFKSLNPTAEQVAELVYHRIESAARALGAEIARVTVWEAESCSAAFVPSR